MSKRKTSNKGILFVVSAPSGAGKTTLVQKLLGSDPSLARTVSHTTRKPRPKERNGKDYFFVSRQTFDRLLKKGAFLEWIDNYGQRYGTSHQTVNKGLKAGKDMVLVIEERGARAVRKHYRDAVFVLVLPPNRAELKRRIVGRSGKFDADAKTRYQAALKETRAMKWYSYLIVNDTVSTAVEELQAIVRCERLRLSRNPGSIGRFLGN